MGIFQKPSRRTVQLKIMVTPEEKKAIDGAAKRLDLTTSNLIREAIERYVEWRESDKKSKKRS